MSTNTQGSRCTGHCCAKFFLPFDNKEELKALASNAQDFAYIYDMVIKLPEQTEDGAGNPYAPDDHEHRNHWWTCKHHDSVTGDCKAYDKRPEMCSAYPYGGPCLMKGCTADCAKEKWEAEHPKLNATKESAKAATKWSRTSTKSETLTVKDEELEGLLKEVEAEFKAVAKRKVTRDELFTAGKSGNRK